MTVVVSTRELAQALARLDEAGFVAAHPQPALLVPAAAAPARGGPHQTLTGEEEPGADAPLDLPSAQVAFLAKSARNPFGMMITVGRAPNNDVVLADRAVSKFHASFRSSPTGWILTDQRSANGTYVDGRRLAPGESTLLPAEATIRFGRTLTTRFVTPAALHRLLAALTGA